jgi:hypothetical protein
MSRNARTGIFALGLALLVAISLLQSDIDPKRRKIVEPFGAKQTQLIFQLPGPYILATFTGMRETVAGLLWVRCDEFFHQGNYEAIMPLVRLITWLDPHYMDVYKTGAWHLDFNICDSSERSDRRYIPPALALLAEGVKNNPETYDLPFELGFTHYNLKIRDFKKSVEWLKKASTLPDLNPETQQIYERYPLVVKRMLAHEYEKFGDIQGAKTEWVKVIADTKKLIKERPSDELTQRDLIIAQSNYDMLLWREAHRKWDIVPTIDTNFQARWVKKKSKVMEISGTVNLISKADYLALNPLASAQERSESTRVRTDALKKSEDPNWANGARVDIVLSDLDYKPETLKEFSWNIPKDTTVMVDMVRTVNGKFETEVDLSKDPQMYSLKSKKYKLTITIDPRQCPDYMQDRIGWHGESITDKNCLDTKTIPGVRMLRKEWIIDRKDII